MTPIPTNADTFLTREQTVAALKAVGFPIERATLATMATRGGGPPFQKFGRVPLYRWRAVLAWAQAKLSAPRGSTSEADADARRSPRPKKTAPRRRASTRQTVAPC